MTDATMMHAVINNKKSNRLLSRSRLEWRLSRPAANAKKYLAKYKFITISPLYMARFPFSRINKSYVYY